MYRTPLPRPWMPLHYRRFMLAHTTVPYPAPPAWRAALLRQTAELRASSPPGALARLRSLFRDPPPIQLRIDELTEKAEAWVADLTNDDSGAQRPR